MKAKKLNGNTVLLIITIALFFVMYAVGCVIYSNKGFTHLQTFLNILINNAGLLCITCGMTCVMLTGGIDISVGSLVAMDCMILAVGMERWNMNAVLLCILVLAIGIVFGVVQGFCVGYLNIQPFIVTMAGMFFARGMTAVISTEQISISSNAFFAKLANTKISLPFGSYTNNKGVVQVPFIRVSVIVALLVLIAVFFMLRYTKFGRSLYAVGGSEQSATMMGLDVKKTKLKAYVLSSFLCSIGGICYCLNTMSGNVQQALGLEMDAIASSVIGGTLLTGGVGNVIGSFFGVLINGTISTLVKTNGKLLQLVVQHCGGCAALLLHRITEYLCKDQREEQIKTRLSRGCPLHAAAFWLLYGKIPCCVKKAPRAGGAAGRRKGGRNMNIFQKRTVGKKGIAAALLASPAALYSRLWEWGAERDCGTAGYGADDAAGRLYCGRICAGRLGIRLENHQHTVL